MAEYINSKNTIFKILFIQRFFRLYSLLHNNNAPDIAQNNGTENLQNTDINIYIHQIPPPHGFVENKKKPLLEV